MNPFQILEPESLEDAFQLFDEHRDQGCLYLNGGTDLLPALRKEAIAPAVLIDLQGLGLNAIRETPEGLEIGSACTLKQLYSNPLVRSRYPALSLAALSIGCVQTRGVATVGGNLCSALPSMDTAPPVLVHDARLELEAKTGRRNIPAEDFFVGPRKTCLAPGEVLTKLILPAPAPGTNSHFLKFGRRNTLTLAIVNEAVSITLRDGCLFDVRVSVGACAPVPVRIHSLEQYLEGRPVQEIEEEAVARLVAGEIRPIDDLRASGDYRRALAGSLVCKSLRAVTGRADPEDLVIGGSI